MVSYSEESKEATQKFFAFLRAYNERLSVKLTGLRNELVFFDAIKRVIEDNYINELLNMRVFDGLDEDVKEALEEIKYLNDNKISNVPQYQSAMQRILSNKKVKDLDKSVSECKERIEAYELGIEIVSKILNNVPVNTAQLIRLLDGSNLTEEEVLLVLEDYTYGACPDYERPLETEVQKIDVPEQPYELSTEAYTYETSEQIDSTIKEYLDFKEKAEAFYQKYKFLIENDDSRTREKRKGNAYLIQILESNFDVMREIPFEEKLATLIYQLGKALSGLNDFDSFSRRLNTEELLELKYSISTLSSLLKLGSKLEKKVPFDEEEKNEKLTQRIIFLTDDEEKPLFDFEKQKFTNEDKKRVRTILYRLGISSMLDDKKKSKDVLGPLSLETSHNMHVIQEGSIRCSFVRLSRDVILVITFDSSESIFRETIKLDNRYYVKIEALKNLANKDPDSLIEITETVTGMVYDSVSSTGKSKGGE